ncbi:hypothetical protein [Sulfurimonas sp.]|uniref:hypothetical protein n=1 Tax=Sulfurimonas sp. TaxID=2022749 RepID=UPI003D0E3934
MYGFWLGYLLGSSDDNNNHQDSGDFWDGVNGFIFLLVFLTTYIPIAGVIGFKLGQVINDINLLKWGLTILFILLTYKSLYFIGTPIRYIMNPFKEGTIKDILFHTLFFLQGYILLVLVTHMKFLDQDKILPGFLNFYNNIFSKIFHWLFAS